MSGERGQLRYLRQWPERGKVSSRLTERNFRVIHSRKSPNPQVFRCSIPAQDWAFMMADRFHKTHPESGAGESRLEVSELSVQRKQAEAGYSLPGRVK